nr:MAG TPA: hypothetical protein [Caudoviricetes sp.]
MIYIINHSPTFSSLQILISIFITKYYKIFLFLKDIY